jgi:hypothetical protein
MPSVITNYILASSSIIFSMGASAYFLMCLNPDLMADFIVIWVTLLVMGVLSVLEFIYFITALVFLIMKNYTLGLTLNQIIRSIDPILQFLSIVVMLGAAYIFDPANGNDDGIFQIIVILAMSCMKTFITYTTLVFLNDINLHPPATIEVSDRQGPYAYVPSKDTEVVEPEQDAKPMIVVPAQRMIPIYVMHN